MIEIELSIIPSLCVKSIATTGIETREMTYEELVAHLEKSEISLSEKPTKKEIIQSQISGGGSHKRKVLEEESEI